MTWRFTWDNSAGECFQPAVDCSIIPTQCKSYWGSTRSSILKKKLSPVERNLVRWNSRLAVSLWWRALNQRQVTSNIEVVGFLLTVFFQIVGLRWKWVSIYNILQFQIPRDKIEPQLILLGRYCQGVIRNRIEFQVLADTAKAWYSLGGYCQNVIRYRIECQASADTSKAW